MNSPNPIMSQAMKTIENSICSSLERFQNERFGTVRVVMRDGDPWFVAKDVADCIEHRDVSSMCRLCRDKDKIVASASDFDSADLAESGNSRIILISESGLYRILAKCNLPKCDPFESWVFDEILPSIRRTGSYSIQPTQPALPQSYLEALKALVVAEEAKEAAQKALEAEKEQHEADNRDFQEGLDIMNAKCAQIATRQLATAMSTASAKSRECKRLTNENEDLREQIGDATNLKAVRAIPWLKEFFIYTNEKEWSITTNVIGRQISKICDANGFRKVRIPDPHYEKGILAYDIKAIEVFKGKLIQDLNYMRKYRIY